MNKAKNVSLWAFSVFSALCWKWRACACVCWGETLQKKAKIQTLFCSLPVNNRKQNMLGSEVVEIVNAKEFKELLTVDDSQGF